jgi:hypothetical protein
MPQDPIRSTVGSREFNGAFTQRFTPRFSYKPYIALYQADTRPRHDRFRLSTRSSDENGSG